MGYLKEGKPLSFTESRPYLKHVRRSGIEQFLNHYLRSRRAHTPVFLWGDEVEYGVFSRGPATSEAEVREQELERAADGAACGCNEKSAPAASVPPSSVAAGSGSGSGSLLPLTPPPLTPTASTSTSTGRKYDLCLRGAEIRKYLAGIELKAQVPLEERARKEGRTLNTEVAQEGELACLWAPEYGAWMVEAVPAAPYGGFVEDLLLTEQSMRMRRQRMHMALFTGEIAPSMVNFPMLGVEGYGHYAGPDGLGDVTNSLYVRDEIINPHPRFAALTRNIRIRRGHNVQVLGYKDPEATAAATATATGGGGVKSIAGAADSSGVVHMDAMAFGMGCCCLQVTMQCSDEAESRSLHDQLATFAPYFLALSAATPIFRGVLLDTDTRWEFIGQSVDCRTDAERSVPGASTEPDASLAGGGVKPFRNSRYSGSSLFIGKARNEAERLALEQLNDLPTVIDEELLAVLEGRGVDSILSKHLAHIFARDPLVIFEDGIHLDEDAALDHFDNLQSTNWRTMRWKPPSLPVGFEAKRRQEVLDAMGGATASASASAAATATATAATTTSTATVSSGSTSDEGAAGASAASASATAVDTEGPLGPTDESWFQKNLGSFGPGWRVEFRPMEVSLTDFENAAFSVIVVLMTRALTAYGYNFYMPMSHVEENLRRSKLKDACLKQKFFIRKHAFQARSGSDLHGAPLVPDDMELLELSIDEIFNGKDMAAADGDSGSGSGSGSSRFLGLIPAALRYLDDLGCPAELKEKLSPYMTLLRRRASGELPTTARWMRNFVQSHPAYAGDGTINPVINDDLCKVCDDIGMGLVQMPSLYGESVRIASLACITAEQSAPFLEMSADRVKFYMRACSAQKALLKRVDSGVEAEKIAAAQGAQGIGPSGGTGPRTYLSTKI